MNIDVNLIEEKITNKTKAIFPVHYAGVACDMDKIMEIAKKYNLIVVEDAAQAVLAYYKGKPLGTIGDYGCFSFHETKNYIMGEGGGIIVKDNNKFLDAEIERGKDVYTNVIVDIRLNKFDWSLEDFLSACLFLTDSMKRGSTLVVTGKTLGAAYKGMTYASLGMMLSGMTIEAPLPDYPRLLIGTIPQD